MMCEQCQGAHNLEWATPIQWYWAYVTVYSWTRLLLAQAAQAHYVWVQASEVIWSEYTRIINVLSDAK